MSWYNFESTIQSDAGERVTDQHNERLTKDAVVSFQEITKETLRPILDLNVREDQTHFVAPNSVSIAQAHFEPEHAWFRAIYADETPVGFLMLYDDAEKSEYFLWRFMIDAALPENGVRQASHCTARWTCTHTPKRQAVARQLYPRRRQPLPILRAHGLRVHG